MLCSRERLDAVISRQAEISKNKNQGLLDHIFLELIEEVSLETDFLLKEGRLRSCR